MKVRWVSVCDDSGKEHIVNPLRVRRIESIDIVLRGDDCGSRIVFSDHDELDVVMTPLQFAECAGIDVHEICNVNTEDAGPKQVDRT